MGVRKLLAGFVTNGHYHYLVHLCFYHLSDQIEQITADFSEAAFKRKRESIIPSYVNDYQTLVQE